MPVHQKSDEQLSLLMPIERVPGVAARRAEAFRRIGVVSLAHLINHVPHRHEREEAEGSIEDLELGTVVSVRGEIGSTKVLTYGRKPRFEATLLDDTGRVELVWFNQAYLATKIHAGDRIRVQGKAGPSKGGSARLTNPRWELLPEDADEPGSREARLRPVYPATEDLPSWAIEKVVSGVLDQAVPLLEDHLSDEYRAERALPTLGDAFRMIHRPESDAEVSDAQRRLIYDELLLLQLGVAMKREYIRRSLRAPVLECTPEIDERIRARIPFTLTKGQASVIEDISDDLGRQWPANRLIQGDVGAGKTVVALHAMLLAVAHGHQGALMAPTELLAEQHYQSISELLEGSKTRVRLLTGSLPEQDRLATLDAMSAGSADIVIGTHALVGEAASFRSLAVAVIDEQHRFGVHQRALMRERKAAVGSPAALSPHVLVMTATPIPRTLSLTIFGDLDVSTLRGLPPGRKPVATRRVHGARRGEVHAFICERVDAGDQAFAVVPAIGESGGEVELRNVNEVLAELESGPLAGKRVAAVHGRLKRDEREHIMGRFRAGLIDVVVATSVIEVGVDVPNATLMVIEQAERFGLAQLHQLRGRVGRGEKPGVCVLVTGGGTLTPEAEARLDVLVESNDGFVIAEKDLEIRGPGEVIGTRQSGVAPFRIATFPRDTELLMLARRDAQAWIEASPTLGKPGEALVRRRLLKAHGEGLGLADVA